MSRIIFVNRYYDPDSSATSQLLTDLARHLAARGDARIHVVCSRFCYRRLDQRLPARARLAGVKVHRVGGTRLARFNLLGRAVDDLVFLAAAGWRLLALTRPGDTIVAKTDPPWLGLLAALVAFSRRARLVHWLQDIYPELASVLGSRLVGFLSPPLAWLRDLAWRRADRVVVIGGAMRWRVAAAGVAHGRIHQIENWCDGQTIRPVPASRNPLRRAWQLEDRFVVGYSGNFGRAHELAPILALIRAIRPEEPIRLLFIGGGPLLDELQHALSEPERALVQFRPYQPRAELACSLSLPDLHLISLRPELEGVVVPSKLYGVMAAGRPALFIGDPEGEVARTLTRHDCGLAVGSQDHANLIAAVRRLAGEPDTCRRLGAAARHAFERHYDRPRAMAAFEAALLPELAQASEADQAAA